MDNEITEKLRLQVEEIFLWKYESTFEICERAYGVGFALTLKSLFYEEPPFRFTEKGKHNDERFAEIMSSAVDQYQQAHKASLSLMADTTVKLALSFVSDGCASAYDEVESILLEQLSEEETKERLGEIKDGVLLLLHMLSQPKGFSFENN